MIDMYTVSSSKDSSGPIEFLTPNARDGLEINNLIAKCPPLDTNSTYCNLLQAHHFANTSVSAKIGDQLVGFVSGYRVPERENTLFVWQVAVGEAARGQGLASKMIKSILKRPRNHSIDHIETTITESNSASWGLFEGLANKLDAELASSILFHEDEHFNGEHDSEVLVKIGPFAHAQHLAAVNQ